jgi:flavin reductase (DIM6/NTAB) family NADH-FMN oxidoreductase RutF
VNAPIVKEFPYALECNLIKRVDLGLHTMFIGEIVGMVAESDILNPNQLPDIEKIRPMLWGSMGSMGYYGIGEKLGDAFSVGKELGRR